MKAYYHSPHDGSLQEIHVPDDKIYQRIRVPYMFMFDTSVWGWHDDPNLPKSLPASDYYEFEFKHAFHDGHPLLEQV